MKPLRHIWLTLFTLAALALLLSLGAWQLQRLEWKRELIASIEAAKKAPSRPLAELIESDEDLSWRRAEVKCDGSGQLPAFVRYGLNEGRISWRAMSGCKLVGSVVVVWLDRGIIDAAVGNPDQPQNTLPPPRAAMGVIRTDVDYTSFPHDCDPITVECSSSRVFPGFLAVELETPRPVGVTPTPLPPTISNRHLEYALTWFGLAGALVAVYAAVLIQDRRRPRGEATAA